MNQTTSQTNPTQDPNPVPVKVYHAALYARRIFSDLVQPDDSDPPTAEQIRDMKEHLQELTNIQVDGIYMDSRRIHSSHARPQFQKLLLDIQQGTYNCIVMYSLDRFGQNETENTYYVLRQFTTLGLRIISLLDDYDSEISETISGEYLTLEKMIRQNHAFDRSRKRAALMRTFNEQGRIFNKQKVPYGYRYNPEIASNMEIDTEVADYIPFIFEEYVCKGKSTVQIAKHLTKIAAPSPSMRSRQLGTRSGKMPANDYWQSGSVLGILKNRMYTGDFTYGKESYAIYANRDYSSRHRQGNEQIIPDHHKPLISHELFEQAQTKIRQNQKSPVNRFQETPEYASQPFRKRMFCAVCGRVMISSHASEPNRCRFVCVSHTRKLADACHYPSIPLRAILPKIREALLDERYQALTLYEQMKDGKKSSQYQQIDACYQEKIDALIQSGQQVTEALSSLLEDDSESQTSLLEKRNQVNQELTTILQEKTAFHRRFLVTNSWLSLYSQLDCDFTWSPAFARKYIYRIDLYPDASVKLHPMKQDAKECLLSYIKLLDEHENHTQ